jgi:hypothetical protein
MKQLKLTIIALCALATASSFGAITYIDALEGSNTYATGGSLTDTSWVGTSTGQWKLRTDIEGNEDTMFQGNYKPVELTTEITGLADGTYTIWAFFGDNTESDGSNFSLSAGLISGALTSYSAPGEPAVTNCTTNAVVDADTLDFTTAVKTTGVTETNRNLFGVNLGQVVVSGGSVVNVYIDNYVNELSGSDNRTWYDGIGYERDTSAPIYEDIVYVDALEGSNTYATGGSLADTSWVGTSTGQWRMRTDAEGNAGTVYQNSLNPVELTTEITGLANGTYAIWAFFWDNTESDGSNWALSAGLTSGALTSYSAPGEPSVTNCTTTGVADADTLSFTTAVKTTGSDGINPNLFGVNLGQVVVSNGAAINIYIDNEVNALISDADNRTQYDGVGYAKMITGYSDWSNDFGLVEGPAGDDDRDGVPNLSEYGIGGDPTDALDTGLATQTFLENSGGTNWLTLVYPARADNDGITLFLETSDSLTEPAWINAGYTVLGTNVTGGEFNTITNRISTADSQTLFARLRVELD